jgi:hypothetical protein
MIVGHRNPHRGNPDHDHQAYSPASLARPYKSQLKPENCCARIASLRGHCADLVYPHMASPKMSDPRGG